MTRLYALDFDKTLVPYDSFRLFLKALLRVRPFRVGCLLVLRKLRILNAAAFKRRVTVMVENNQRLQELTLAFASRLMREAKLPEPAKVDTGGLILIISASPACYMRYIEEIDERRVVVAASDYCGEDYSNLYGAEKKQFLLERFPQQQFEYTFAMSDSDSDMCWMQLFNQYEIKQ